MSLQEQICLHRVKQSKVHSSSSCHSFPMSPIPFTMTPLLPCIAVTPALRSSFSLIYSSVTPLSSISPSIQSFLFPRDFLRAYGLIGATPFILSSYSSSSPMRLFSSSHSHFRPGSPIWNQAVVHQRTHAQTSAHTEPTPAHSTPPKEQTYTRFPPCPLTLYG